MGVVVGTVVGGTYTVVVVVEALGTVVVALGTVVVALGTAVVVVVVALGTVVVALGAFVVVVLVGAMVVVVLGGITTVGAALLAMKPTRTPEATLEPMKTERVRRRTRAKRRSRCWGVRRWVLKMIAPPKV